MPASYFTYLIIFSSAILLRIILLLYGLIQDKYSPLPYTDIDYFVFTDAARYVSNGHSPYLRETYRYTPLLAWLLLPTAWSGVVWFSFGKVLFAVADIVAGWLIILVLRSPAGGGMATNRALKFASIWLLNPMVATISTRGSSEGLLGVMVVALLWAVLTRRIKLAGMLLGLAVHFKLYPFIYGISIIWYLEPTTTRNPKEEPKATSENPSIASISQKLFAFLTPTRITLLISSLATFTALNVLMYAIYGKPFLTYTYLHHLTRIDHRHNFSPYNTLLHLNSAMPTTNGIHFESLAFLPQLALSAVLIPLALAKKDLAGAMLAQTFAFVAFNKVCTSQVRAKIFSHAYEQSRFFIAADQHYVLQATNNINAGDIYLDIDNSPTYGHRLKNTRHPVRSAIDKLQIERLVVGSVTTSEYRLHYFLWYLILLPFYLPYSTLLSSPRLGITAAALWVGTQAAWLQQAYALEFLGQSTFFPGLFVAGLAFFAVNCWILGIMVGDVGGRGGEGERGRGGEIGGKRGRGL